MGHPVIEHPEQRLGLAWFIRFLMAISEPF